VGASRLERQCHAHRRPAAPGRRDREGAAQLGRALAHRRERPLVDAAGTRIGRVQWACTTTVGARDFRKSTATCHGVAALRDGTLTFQFSLSPTASTTTAAVTGGTGAYANARGVVFSKGTKAGADDTVTLVE
jgi:hypothetical protein